MNLVEAHEVLGIDETVAADTARRAYLKLLKKHRPESDPEGFQRIREAHEIVASHLSMFGHRRAEIQFAAGPAEPMAPAAGIALGPETPTEPSSTVQTNEVVDEAPEITQYLAATPHLADAPHFAGAPDLEGAPPWLDRVREEIEEEKKRGEAADWASFFVKCLGDCPDADDAWELYYELEEDESIAAELLRAASQAGLAGFEDSLVLLVPQLATEQELVAVADSGHASSTLFSLFLAAGDLERAGPAALSALEAEAGRDISGYRLLELLFGLEASGSEKGGPLLFEKINEHIASRLDERELFGNCVTSWILASEYFSARSRLSPIGRIFLGGVCRQLDWEAAPQLAMNWRPPSPLTRGEVVPSVRAALAGHAPTLLGVIFPGSADETGAPAASQSSRSGVPWWTISILVFGGFRLLRGCVPDEPPPSVDHSTRTNELLNEALKRQGERERPPAPDPVDAPLGPPSVPVGNEPVLDGWFGLRANSVANFHRGTLGDDCDQMEGALADLAWYQKRAPADKKALAAAENEELNNQYIEQCKTEADDEQE